MNRSPLERLAARRWRLAISLTALMLMAYFSFILGVAFGKERMGTILTPGLSWGVVLGAAVIVVAWVLTGIYVRWANNVYDGELAALEDHR